MILSDRQIKEAVENGRIVIEPFERKQVQPASYDLRVGHQGATTVSKRMVDIRTAGFVTLEPGDFGVITLHEKIGLDPQHTARFGLRSKYARKGLIATTGPQIDPGFRGRLIIGLANLTPRPILVPYLDDVVSVEFHRLEEPVETPYSGPYQDGMELGAEEMELIAESESIALSETIDTLRSLSENVGILTKNVTILTSEVRSIKWSMPVILAIGLTAIGYVVSR